MAEPKASSVLGPSNVLQSGLLESLDSSPDCAVRKLLTDLAPQVVTAQFPSAPDPVVRSQDGCGIGQI